MAGHLFFSRPLLRAGLPPLAFMVCSCVYSHTGPFGCTWTPQDIAAELGTVTAEEAAWALRLLTKRHILSTGNTDGRPAYVPMPEQSWVRAERNITSKDLDLDLRSREIERDPRAIPPTTDHPHGVGVGSRDSSREIETKPDRDPEPAAPTDITVARCRTQIHDLSAKLSAPARRYASTPADLPHFWDPPEELAAKGQKP